MTICVMGLWHLGLVTAGCLASIGNNVVGLDFDSKRVSAISAGDVPVYEPGLFEAIKNSQDLGKLSFTALINSSVRSARFLWVAYDTPVDDNDVADTNFVINSIRETLPCLAKHAVVIVSSQLPVGSVKSLENYAAIDLQRRDLDFVCIPENLRLGRALDVFLNPDRIVIGIRNERVKEKIVGLLGVISKDIVWMSIESAEMTKHAINAFLATSVSFVNELASICERIGADATEVERGLKSEQRIGPRAYLSPGGAFAGGTLARDVQFLQELGGQYNLNTPLISSIIDSNNNHKWWSCRLVEQIFPELQKVSIAIWGLTYKPGTDTLRRSQALELCSWFVEKCKKVHVHDPRARALPRGVAGTVQRFDDAIEAIKGVDVLVVSTEWPLYKEISVEELEKANPNLTVLDANAHLAHLRSAKRIAHFSVGVSSYERKIS